MSKLLEQVTKVCQGTRNGQSWMGKCPAHEDKRNSLAYWQDQDGRLALKCYAGCTRQDVIQALADAGVEDLVKSDAAKGNDSDEDKKIKGAQAIWDDATDEIQGTPAEHYLKSRKLDEWPLGSARYWGIRGDKPEEDQRALVTPIFDANNRIQGVQRLYLTSDGDKADVTPSRRINGRRRGGGCHLPGVGPTILCEGFETGLSIWLATSRHVVCTLGLANLDKLPLGANQTVVIARDLDKSGSKADKQLWRVIRKLRERGVTVLVAVPTEYDGLKKSDFNDVLVREGRDKVRELIEGAQELDEKDQAASWRHTVDDPIEVVKELNEKYLVVKDGGKTIVFEERFDEVMNRWMRIKLSFTDFRNYFMNREVQIGNTPTPLGDYWLEHRQRRQYEHVVFEPVNSSPTDYNLWRGWGYEPEIGDWSLLKTHIYDNICSGKKELFEYFICWMAHKVQNLDSQGHVATVLRGKRGVGKGTIGHAFGKLFGQHYLHVSQARHITGNFNSHLRDCLFLFADEAFWAGDKQGEAVLKTIITEPTLTIEGKGKDVVSERNRVAMLVASNQSWVVPAGMEERRFFVLDVDDKKMQDTSYFKAIMAQMAQDGGKGYSGFLLDLLNWDLTKFNVNKVPQTAGLLEQKLASMQPVEKWWLEALQAGRLLQDQDDWETPWTAVQLHGAFLEWASKIRLQRLPTQGDLLRLIQKLLPVGKNKESDPLKRVRLKADATGHRAWGYKLQPLTECREHFESLVKQPIPWEEVEEREVVAPSSEDQIPF